ncbi:MAG: CpaF family protein [Anaerolineae bacterium]|nr:CpaF family protein [Anaerolineae bacterium]
MPLLNHLQQKPSSEGEGKTDRQSATSKSGAAVGSPRGPQRSVQDLRSRVQAKVLSELKIKDVQPSPELRAAVEELFQRVVVETGVVLSRVERTHLMDEIVNDIIGLGPLEALLQDPDTTDVMVVGPDRVYVERLGRIHRTSLSFESEAHMKRIIDRITTPLGRRVDENSPMVDARLRDGSRVNVVVRPVSLDGPVITIRKFSEIPFTEQDLINFGTGTSDVFEFLRAIVTAQLNVLVSGGSSSGKTTLLNVMSGYVPNDERIVTIENAAELQLRQPHVVRLETRPANLEGKGEMTVRELVINSLRMRPDRIVVGEVRGGEALDLIQAMNTGHDGSLGTLHANTAKDALSRLETMILSAGMQLPVRAIREQVSSAVQLIVHMTRTRDGARHIVQISELAGMEGDTITLDDLFLWEQTAITEEKILGRLSATGIVPRCIQRIEDAGIRLPMSIFEPRGSEAAASSKS